MKIGSLSENKDLEKRISITPEIAKKYISLGLEVYLDLNYGSHLGFDDDQYKDIGVKVLNNQNDIISNTDLLVQLNLLSDENLSKIKENQSLIGMNIDETIAYTSAIINSGTKLQFNNLNGYIINRAIKDIAAIFNIFHHGIIILSDSFIVFAL